MPSLIPVQLAFFSYAHEDAEFALRLAKDMRAGGAAVWIDRLDIKPGQRWDRAIEDALAKCPQLLVILSPAAIESTNVMDEVSLALEEGKTVLPVVHRQCKIPFRLRRLQYVDLTLNYDQGLGRLLETLGFATPSAMPEEAADQALDDSAHDGEAKQVNLLSQAAPKGGATLPILKKRVFGSPKPLIGIVAVLVAVALLALVVVLSQLGVFKQTEKKVTPAPEAVQKPAVGVTAARPDRVKPNANRLDLGRTTFITDQGELVKTLATYLENKGAEVSVISTDQLDSLAATRPDTIIVCGDTGAAWGKISKTVLSRLFEDPKIIAFGNAGTNLFRLLGLRIADPNGMHSRESAGTQLVVQVPEILQSPLTIPAENQMVQVYEPSTSDVIGIYDDGSPMVAGFEGIAHWSKWKNHWPVCRQGNYVLWGFSAPTSEMTDAGKQLFVNLLVNLKARPSVPLSQARRKAEYIKSGLISERLSKQFPDHKWPFQVKNTGHINARLSWTPPDVGLAFILGTEQRRRFERKDGRSPLTIDYDVNEEDVAHSDDDWFIGVTCFGDIGTKVIDYQLELSLPQ
jgi:TIR domain